MTYIVRVSIGSETVYRVRIANGQTVTFGNGPKDDVEVVAWSPKFLRITASVNGLKVVGKKIPDFSSTTITTKNRFELISKQYGISVSLSYDRGESNRTYKLPFNGIVTIGRSGANTITLNDSAVSGTHLTIRCEEGSVRVEDGKDGRPSSNGTYLNTRRISKALLKSGDVLDVCNMRIVFKNMMLHFDNVGDCLRVSNSPMDGGVSIRNTERITSLVYRRSPRARRALPEQDIVLAKAPPQTSKFEKRRGMFTSLISSGAMIGVSAATGFVSPALIAARAAGMAAPVANIAMTRGDNKKGKKKWEQMSVERQERYTAYIDSQRANISMVAEQQRSIIKDENPAVVTCHDIVNKLQPKLWERRPNDSDFLKTRIGMGYEPLCVNVKSPADSNTFQMEDDELENLAKLIIEETRVVDDLPLRADLLKYQTVGLVGNHDKVVGLLRNMLISLSTLHFYEDVRIVGIFDKKDKALWSMLKWLPHVWDEDKQNRFLAFDEKDAARISETFDEILKYRLQEADGYNASRPAPHYVFILGSYAYTRKSKLMQYLSKNNTDLGTTTLFAYDLGDEDSQYQMTYLPSDCQFVIDTDGRYGAAAYEFAKANKQSLFTLDEPLPLTKFDEFCRTMSAIHVTAGAGKAQLPNGVTYLEGLGVSNVDELDIWGRWSNENKSAVLGANLGVLPGGKILNIDVGDFTQPPISLVAGMSGSGKSEFLKTWILDLAVNYSPQELSMVIIDYKGGSMAHSVEDLPHVTGKITDIQSGDIMRPLAALSYEMTRRKKIFDRYNVLEYKEYVKLLRSGDVTEPLPLMLIICDEFAELMQQHKAFMTELVHLARVGRSLGMRLILATQSPAGVVSQDLFDNSRFQICLKVQNAAASKSMIQRPDAARITQNGRAYVRAGSDEIFELIQSFWTGAPYLGDKDKKASTGNQVRIVNIAGQRIKTVKEEKTRFKSSCDELTAVIRHINEVTDAHGIERMPCPWNPELPAQISLSDLNIPGGFDGADWRPALDWLQVPIGMFDAPEEQKQGVQYINFETDGHYGIYGLPGSGKTVMLKTIIMGLGMYYKPTDVNVYVIDLGSQTLKKFEKLPHVAGIALGSEEEKIGKMAGIFENLLSERKKMFAKHGISSLKMYRDRVDDEVPAIVLAIDNFVPLFEVCPAFEQIIYKLASEGSSYGIYIVYTANNNNGIRYKLTQSIYSGIAFEMIDKASYNDVVGRINSIEKLGKTKGRGFIKGDYSPILFQAATYGEGADETHWQDWADSVFEKMNRYWDGPSVETLPTIPDAISAQDLKAHYQGDCRIPAGISAEDAKPMYLDCTERSCGIVIGRDAETNSNILESMADIVQDHGVKMYVIDSMSSRLASLASGALQYTRCDDVESVDAIFKALIRELMDRQKAQKSSESGFNPILLLIDDLNELLDSLDSSDGAYSRMNAIVKNADGLGLMMIAAVVEEDMKELHLQNAIASRFANSQNALLLSGTPMANNYLKQDNLSATDKIAVIAGGKGMLYRDGKAYSVISM